MITQFLDAAYPRSAAQFLGALRVANAEGFTFYIGGDIALAPWDKAIVDAVRAQYPGMAIHVPDLDAGDGAEAVALARAYALPPGYKIALDIEPGIFRAKASPAIAAAYAEAWCDAVRAARFTAVVYGTAATCAACANHADLIWLTIPGAPDPAQGGLAAGFFAGRRAVQYASVVLNGVQCDVSNSQYRLADFFGSGSTQHPGGDDMTPGLASLLSELANLIGLGRLAGSYPDGTPGDKAVADAILAAANSPQPVDWVGPTLGSIVNSPEGQAWLAKLAWLHQNLNYDPTTKAVTLKASTVLTDDDTALASAVQQAQAAATAASAAAAVAQTSAAKVESAVTKAAQELAQA